MTLSEVNEMGRAAYRAGEPESANPFPRHSASSTAWDAGYWWEHDESYVEDTGGIEEGYGDFYEAEACRWDDDPSPYNGDYSEM